MAEEERRGIKIRVYAPLCRVPRNLEVFDRRRSLAPRCGCVPVPCPCERAAALVAVYAPVLFSARSVNSAPGANRLTGQQVSNRT